MSDHPGRHRVSLSVEPGSDAAAPIELEERPFQVVLIGDFSGQDVGAASRVERLADRRPSRLTSIDDELRRLRPTVEVQHGDGRSTHVEFTRLDDFHPDRLVARIPYLAALIEALDGPVGGGVVVSLEEGVAPDPARAGRPEATAPPTEVAGLLDEIVDASGGRDEGGRAGPLDDLGSWVRSVVAPHLEGGDSPDERAWRARLGGAIASEVRGVLHEPAVHALERLWRAAFFLLTVVDPVPGARLYLLDLSRRELRSLVEGAEPHESPLFRLLTESLPGPGAPTPPAVFVGCYEFGPEAGDVALLNRLTMLAYLAGAPWLSAASAALLGLQSFGEGAPSGPESLPPAWSAYRETPAAGAVALFAPPFLLREPYGRATDPCSAIDFEEIDRADRARYLWGNPAVLGGAALVHDFGQAGWRSSAASAFDLTGRPMHAAAGGDEGAYPLEALWDVDAVGRVRESGINPIVGFRDDARIRLPGIRSAALPPRPVEAWWRA